MAVAGDGGRVVLPLARAAAVWTGERCFCASESAVSPFLPYLHS